MHFVVGACAPIDIADACRAVRLWVHEHLRGHGVRDDATAACLLRVHHRRVGSVEVRERRAATLARPAHVARRAAVDRPRQVGGASLRDRAPHARADRRAHVRLDTRETERRLQLLIGQLRDALVDAADADVSLDEIVVGRQVGVREWPVDAEAVPRGCLEIDVAVAVTLAAPHVRAAADDAGAAHPGERQARGRGVGLVGVVDEPVRIPLRAGITGRLLRLRSRHHRLRAGPQRERVRRGVLAKVLGPKGSSRIEHDHREAGFRQPLGRPPAGGAGAHDHHVGRRGARTRRTRQPTCA